MAPLLSIGLPVYNGSRHLREAIDSLLAQDLDDLELVISDNASTDDTPAICAEYASKDGRVRYTRNQTNIGAAANFNRAFELCSGTYFMWGSDDDVWDPRFARLCIDRLVESPESAMCGGRVKVMNDEGVVLPGYPDEYLDTEGLDVAARVRKMTSRLVGSDIYAVIRPEALRSTRLFRPVVGPDTILVLELLLTGDALCVPEVLLHKRLSQTPKTVAAYIEEIDPHRSENAAHCEVEEPLTFMAREMLATVRASHLNPSVVAEIEGDLVNTLIFRNEFWRQLISDEQGWRFADLPTMAAAKAAIRQALHLPAETSMDAEYSAPLRPWRMRPGMRLTLLRRTLLRVMQPFTGGQDRADTVNAYLLSRLSVQVNSLELRVHELERELRR